MKTTIYECLFCRNPQALADLDHYQRRWYDTGIKAPEPTAEAGNSIPVITGLPEVDKLMRQAPSKSRGYAVKERTEI